MAKKPKTDKVDLYNELKKTDYASPKKPVLLTIKPAKYLTVTGQGERPPGLSLTGCIVEGRAAAAEGTLIPSGKVVLELSAFSLITKVIDSETETPAWKPTLPVAIV